MDYDPEKCRQIVDNLVTNAIKFTPEYGQVKVIAKTLSGKDQQPWLEVSFQDTGLGIPADKIPLIFDRFYQVDHSPIQVGEGTGLGLALTKEWIELMDGHIRVSSEVGRGSKFTFRLPIRRQAERVSAPPAQMPPTPLSPVITPPGSLAELPSPVGPADAPLLLIIEDNTDVTYYLQDLLEDQYQIISCRNGKAGVEKALEIIPDLIISDVMMPEMDGFAVCQQLKTDERSSHIPIILITAKATSVDRLTGLKHGADAYLTKPFDKAELLIRLEKLHEIRQQLQQKYSTPLLVKSEENGKNDHPEDQFIQKLESIILDRLEDENFSIHDLAAALHLSRSQANRKVKALTGFSLALYLRRIRLENGKLLLKEGLNVSEVAYRVGFKSAVYFSQTFKDTFGESPTDWLSGNA
jgi:DNA-binding response OmpR family regulator